MFSKSFRQLPSLAHSVSRSWSLTPAENVIATATRLPVRLHVNSRPITARLYSHGSSSSSIRAAQRGSSASAALRPAGALWHSTRTVHDQANLRQQAAASVTGSQGVGGPTSVTGTGVGTSSRQVHVAYALAEDEESFDEEFYDGPDQIIPARSHKCYSASDAVQLQLTETGPAADKPVSVFSLFQRASLLHPQQAALKVIRDGHWQTWSYREYFEESCDVAKAFIALGLDRQHGVCIMGFNSPEWFIASNGAIFAGGISVGIYPNNTGDASALVVEDCKAQILVVDNEETAERLLSVRHKLTNVKAIVQWLGTPSSPDVMSWQDLLQLGRQQTDDHLRHRLKLQAVNQCCTLIYTSGTTGTPKGVMCSQDNLTWCGTQYSNLFNLQSCEESFVSYLPLSHIAGQVTDIYVSSPQCSTVYFAKPDALKGSLIHTIKEVQPTCFLTVPRLLEKMQEQLRTVMAKAAPPRRALVAWAQNRAACYYRAINEGREPSAYEKASHRLAKALVLDTIQKALGLNKVKNFVSGSAPLSDDLVEFFLSLDLSLANVYAMSETHSNGTLCSVDLGCYRSGSVGKAVSFANLNIRETSHSSGTIEGEGEIAFKGRNVFMGYLNSEEKTNETILDDGWMLTGDLGWMDKEGFVFVTGRAKELLVTAGGENIAPLPIEADIKQRLFPIVANAMLVGDQRKFLSILLTINCERDLETAAPLEALTESAVSWLRDRGFEATTVSQVREELANNPQGKVAQGIQEAVDSYNDEEAISNIHKVRRWAMLPHDFSLPTGELNNTLKLKRRVVLDNYAELIDSLYPRLRGQQ